MEDDPTMALLKSAKGHTRGPYRDDIPPFDQLRATFWQAF